MEQKERITINESKGDMNHELSFRKIENGYIKSVNISGPEDDGKWFSESKEYFLEELPENLATLMEKDVSTLADKLTQ